MGEEHEPDNPHDINAIRVLRPLRGGLGRTATAADVLPGYGPRNDDFCRLMLHLLAAPNGTARPRARASGTHSLGSAAPGGRPE